MSDEELIETLKLFEKERVEQINENSSMSEPFNKHEKIISKINEIIDKINEMEDK